MAAILASRILGQLRDTLIAAWFGQNAQTDVYRAAFSIPDLLFFLIAGGALSSSFIPVFTEYITNGEDDKAWKVFSVVATFMTVVVTAFIIFGEIFARQLVPLIAPGFTPDQLDQTAMLTRIVLPSQLCFFLGGLMMATLYVRGHYLVPALGPVVYNLFIILGGWLLRDVVGIAGLAWGALSGAFVGNMLLQFIYVRKIGIQFKPSLDIRHPGVRRVGRLVLPVILGLSLPQVCLLINRVFASLLEYQGAMSALDNANKQMQAPLGIFAQSIGVAIFPTLSAQVARGDMSAFRDTLLRGVKALWFLTIPLSLIMMVLAPEIVSILLGWGRFNTDARNAQVTAESLVFYCIGLAAISSQAILNRAFYAVQNTVTPIVIGTITTFLFIPMNMVLIGPFQHKGLALASSLAAMLHVAWMLSTLKRQVGVPVQRLKQMLLRTTLIAATAAAVGWLTRLGTRHLLTGHMPEKLMELVTVGTVFGLSAVTYMVISALLRSEEAQIAVSLLRRRRA